jgi:hypothetical protein
MQRSEKMDQYFEDKNRVYDGKKIGAMPVH